MKAIFSISRRPGRQLLSLALLWLPVACEGTLEPQPEGPAPVATVQVGPDALSLAVGAEEALTVVLRAADGRVLHGRHVTWTSSNETVAVVSSTGQVRALSPGDATISATSESRTGRTTVFVPEVPVAAVILDRSGEIPLEVGGTVQLRAAARAQDGTVLEGRPITWTTGDPQIAIVTASGAVTAMGVGRTGITASVEGKSASVTVAVGATPGYDLIFDSPTGFSSQPEIYRLDLRDIDASPTRVFSQAGASDATPSPDGSRVAFTCRDIHGTAICVANIDGSDVAMLTGGGGHEDQPAWSPDGTRIAFRAWPQGATPGFFNPTRIWVMNADGAGQTNVTAGAPAGSWQEAPTWSPRQADGSYRIAFSNQSMSGGYRVGQIVSIRQDGSDWRTITGVAQHLDESPSWSPDGHTLAFTRTGGTANGDIWLAGAQGGIERPLMAQDPADDQRSPTWSPDGSLIAFTSKHELTGNNSWRYQIYTVRPDGTGMIRRTHWGADKENPAWIRRN